MRGNFFKINCLFISIFISLLTIFLKGIIVINSQKLSSMNTYSGGYPITWFEFYYPRDVNLTISYVYNNFSNHYKIDIFAFFLNVLAIMFIIGLLKELYNTLIKSKVAS